MLLAMQCPLTAHTPDYRGVFPVCCRRNRALNPGESPYEVVVESLSLGADSSSFDVLNQENGVLFSVELTPVRDNTARIRMREKSPLRPRYEVEGALVSEPEKERHVTTKLCSCDVTRRGECGVCMHD